MYVVTLRQYRLLPSRPLRRRATPPGSHHRFCTSCRRWQGRRRCVRRPCAGRSGGRRPRTRRPTAWGKTRRWLANQVAGGGIASTSLQAPPKWHRETTGRPLGTVEASYQGLDAFLTRGNLKTRQRRQAASSGAHLCLFAMLVVAAPAGPRLTDPDRGGEARVEDAVATLLAVRVTVADERDLASNSHCPSKKACIFLPSPCGTSSAPVCGHAWP